MEYIELFRRSLGINRERARLWAKRMLGDDIEESDGGRTWVFLYERHLKNSRQDCHYVLIETHWFTELLLAWKKGFKLPMWIQFNLETSKPFDEIKISCNRLRHEIPRLIRKNKLELQISKDKQDLSNFVQTMHIPYISGRHNKTALFSSNIEIEKVFAESELLLISQNGTRISGVLLNCSRDRAGIYYIGVKDNNLDYMKQGAVAALYYFGIERTVQKGLPNFNMGDSNPFLNDGLSYFKLTMKPFITQTTYLGGLSS